MKQYTKEINIITKGINLYEFTDKVYDWIEEIYINTGFINISILHTSASLVVQENADNSVLLDLKNYYINLVPFEYDYKHAFEGKDDMPAHIKTSLTNTNLTLSVINSKLRLGTWQGIFLFEHRLSERNRNIVLHYIGN